MGKVEWELVKGYRYSALHLYDGMIEQDMIVITSKRLVSLTR